LPFEAAVESLASATGQLRIRWVSRDLKPPIFDQAVALFEAGRTVRQVASRLEISRSEAGRLRQRAVAEGLLDNGGSEDEAQELELAIQGNSRPN
jgi:hypothetical protein